MSEVVVPPTCLSWRQHPNTCRTEKRDQVRPSPAKLLGAHQAGICPEESPRGLTLGGILEAVGQHLLGERGFTIAYDVNIENHYANSAQSLNDALAQLVDKRLSDFLQAISSP